MTMRYRMLSAADTIQLGDEGLRADCEHWSPLTGSDIVLGLQYAPGFHAPMRRPFTKVTAPVAVETMNEEEMRNLLRRALSFRFDSHLTIVHRGSTGWAVSTGTATVNSDLENEYEPMPSSRTDDYIARTRFSLPRAFEIAQAYVEQEKAEGYYHGT